MGDIPNEALVTDGLKDSRPFPVKNATRPYWRTDLHPIDEYRSTKTLPAECDIAIIGAGMTGVSVAYHLLQALDGDTAPSIVMLEARQVCSGATGRNGGHVKIKTDTFLESIKNFGLDAAMEYKNLVVNQIYALKNAVETENLDCEFELRRSYDVFIDKNEAKRMEDDFRHCLKDKQEWTKDVSIVAEKYTEQVTSIKGAEVAFNVPACSLWPYKFVSQLLARLIGRKNFNVQTNTPVTSLNKSNGVNVLHTPRGIIKAKKVVFATNAYTSGISPEYTNKIIPYRGTAVHITPQSPVSPHLTNTYNINYSLPEAVGETVDYLNPRPDGSIVVGGGKWIYAADKQRWFNCWDDSELIEETKPHFENLMQRNFKGWEKSEANMDMMWTGIMAQTPDGIPHIGEVPGSDRSQYILAGFNGGGMPLIFLCAKGLAKMLAEGVSYDETGLPKVFKTTKERLR